MAASFAGSDLRPIRDTLPLSELSAIAEGAQNAQDDVSRLREQVGVLRFELAKEREEKDRLHRQIVSLGLRLDALEEERGH
jgi:peptidoglycan hydrolase CwlO-like protein